MAAPSSSNSTRAVQVGFIALMIICAAQVGWWYFDQLTYTRQVEQTVLAAYRVDQDAALALTAGGMPPEQVKALFPHVSVGADGGLSLDPQTLQTLEASRARRMRRYGWEAGFFLLVLFAGIGVLLRALAAYEELQRRQQNFLAAVSHEFKSPLASLRLSLESLSRRTPTPERQAMLLGRMDSDLSRFEGMVSNILHTARLEDGEWHLSPAAVSLADAASAAAADYKRLAQATGVTVDVQVGSDLRVHADAHALRSVLGNLIGNAIKACEGVGERVQVRAIREGAQVQLTVSDDGCGFPQEEAGRLFEKFYRPGDEMRRQGGGTGLGLYIVRALVHLSDGAVQAYSEGPGKGATLTVRWPLSDEGAP